MASNKPFNYHSGLWLLLGHIVLSQTWNKRWNDSIEDAEKKYALLTLWMMQSQWHVFLLLLNSESDRMTSHKHGLAAKTVSKWRPPKSPLSRQLSSGKSKLQRLKLRWVEKLTVYLLKAKTFNLIVSAILNLLVRSLKYLISVFSSKAAKCLPEIFRSKTECPEYAISGKFTNGLALPHPSPPTKHTHTLLIS